MLKPDEMSRALAVFRSTKRRTSSTVAVEARAFCACCKKTKPLTEMNFIPDTGIVRRVLDCLCTDCLTAHARDFARAARIVCAGCRETVMLRDPEKERTGFELKSGKCYHVAVCPVCSADPHLKSSQVVEKIAFYKMNSIPYE